MANSQADAKIEAPSYLRLSKVVVWFLYFWIVIGIVSLILRVFLLAFSANMTTGFSQFVANVSADYLQPFRGIFPSKSLGTTGYLDVSALFAILVYLFVAWGISALVSYIQNKIDVSVQDQKQVIAEKKRQVELAALRSQSTGTKKAKV